MKYVSQYLTLLKNNSNTEKIKIQSDKIFKKTL